MNTMKGFYTSITSASQLHVSYLEILVVIIKLGHQQTKALQSCLAWQNWSQPGPEGAKGLRFPVCRLGETTMDLYQPTVDYLLNVPFLIRGMR